MLVSKTTITKIVRSFLSFDSAAAFPFAAIQLGDTPLMYRSSSNGFVESVGFKMDQPKAVISLNDFRDRLNIMPEGDMTLRVTPQGILTLRSDIGPTELCVHTVRPDNAWRKTHDLGATKSELSQALFSGVNIPSSFSLANLPVIRKGKLMLATNHGIAFKSGFDASCFPYPREAAIKAIAGNTVERICLTENGYWDILMNGNRIAVAGHRTGDVLFDTYNTEAAKTSEYPAARLLQAMSAAANLASEGSNVDFDGASDSILVQDIYGQINKFGIGSKTPTFTIVSKTAKVIVDALQQDAAEVISLGRLNADTLQFARGSWTVSFKQVGGR